MSARIRCPGCRETLGRVPRETPDREAGLKGRAARCSRCGRQSEVYFY